MDLNRLGRGVYGNAFARLFGLNDINAVPNLAPEIMPTSSLWEKEEFFELVGGRHGSSNSSGGAGGAGVYNFIDIGPPPGSNLIVIVERILFSAAGEHQWGIIAGTPTSNLPVASRDSRVIAAVTDDIGARVQGGSTALVVLDGGIYTGPAIIDVHYVVSAGFTFMLRGPNNLATAMSIEWRERQADPSELSLR